MAASATCTPVCVSLQNTNFGSDTTVSRTKKKLLVSHPHRLSRNNASAELERWFSVFNSELIVGAAPCSWVTNAPKIEYRQSQISLNGHSSVNSSDLEIKDYSTL
ncbi:hypothetical protein J6590_051778 [Homalodisca vitripennis]|nr:hypothetical protein J6590_051778 [Homalodisca vitripennis]